MPIYKVKPEEDGPCCAPTPGKSKKHYPTVWIRVSADIVGALEIGEGAVVTLKGVVVGLSSNQGPDNERHELTLEIHQVEADEDDDASQEEDEAEEPSMKDAIDEGLGYRKKKE